MSRIKNIAPWNRCVIVVLFLGVWPSAGISQTRQDDESLHGAVYSLHAFSYQASVVSGEVTKGIPARPAGYHDKMIRYDKNGRKIAETIYVPGGPMIRESLMAYDSLGNQVRKEEVLFDSSRTIFLDSNVYSDDRLRMQRYTCLVTDGDTTDVHLSGVYEYDSLGRLSEEILYVEDKLYSRFTYAYDELGNRVETVRYSHDNMLFSTRLMSYDQSGRVVEIIYLPTGGKPETSSITYNDHGDPERVELDAGKSQTTAYEYRYDDHGNWIYRLERLNGKPVYMLERNIQYWDDQP